VHFSSRKRVRLKAREIVIIIGQGCPNTRHEKIMALGRAERAERGSS